MSPTACSQKNIQLQFSCITQGHFYLGQITAYYLHICVCKLLKSIMKTPVLWGHMIKTVYCRVIIFAPVLHPKCNVISIGYLMNLVLSAILECSSLSSLFTFWGTFSCLQINLIHVVASLCRHYPKNLITLGQACLLTATAFHCFTHRCVPLVDRVANSFFFLAENTNGNIFC